MAEWTRTADKFPDVDRFLGINKFQKQKKVPQIHIYEKRPWEPTWAVGGYDIEKDIIWWMPLPEPPEEAE